MVANRGGVSCLIIPRELGTNPALPISTAVARACPQLPSGGALERRGLGAVRRGRRSLANSCILHAHAARFSRPGRVGGAGANIFSMLEEEEVALARAQLHVIEARGRVSDQLAKIARLKNFGESSLEAEHDLGLFEVYLLIVERHRDFIVRSQQQRPNKT